MYVCIIVISFNSFLVTLAMAVASSSASKTKVSSARNKESKEPKKMDQAQTQTKRKSPGVRVVGGRIYDSENGKTCHQVFIMYLSAFGFCFFLEYPLLNLLHLAEKIS